MFPLRHGNNTHADILLERRIENKRFAASLPNINALLILADNHFIHPTITNKMSTQLIRRLWYFVSSGRCVCGGRRENKKEGMIKPVFPWDYTCESSILKMQKKTK